MVHKSLQFSRLPLSDLQTIEAIGVKIAVKNSRRKEMLDLISLYVPRGQQCDEDELTQLCGHTENRNMGCVQAVFA